MKEFRPWFVGTTNAGTMYYRMYSFAKNMKGKDLQVKISGYSPSAHNIVDWENIIKHKWKSRNQLRLLASKSDIIIFQVINTTLALGLVPVFRKLFNIPVLMEIDDYILNVPNYNTAFKTYQAGSERERNNMLQMRESSGMIVSTQYLKDAYLPFNKNIHVVPNGIDFKDWRYTRPRNHKKIRIGYAGSSAHNDDLESIKEPLFEILKMPNVEFICVGGVPDFFKNHPKIKYYVKWATIDTYPEWLASMDFDIGIFPLIHNHFNYAKSNLRWLEYSALKIPTVASNILPCQTIQDAKTGYICKDKKDWYDNLKYLIENKPAREWVGENAYNKVKKDYNVEKTAKKYLKILRSLAR